MSIKSHSIYVIRLDNSILTEKRFRDKNPDYRNGKPCAYVGMTGKTPDERFRQHKNGYKSAKYAKKYGRYLMRKQFEKHNPMSYEQAVEMEKRKANELRAKGYAVWSN
tara:strand:- start:163 stop:486 length:324 start_codon:yes stop_codon:yes gene_type:complete